MKETEKDPKLLFKILIFSAIFGASFNPKIFKLMDLFCYLFSILLLLWINLSIVVVTVVVHVVTISKQLFCLFLGSMIVCQNLQNKIIHSLSLFPVNWIFIIPVLGVNMGNSYL